MGLLTLLHRIAKWIKGHKIYKPCIVSGMWALAVIIIVPNLVLIYRHQLACFLGDQDGSPQEAS